MPEAKPDAAAAHREKKARLAQALRDNLKRRKARNRANNQAQDADAPKPSNAKDG